MRRDPDSRAKQRAAFVLRSNGCKMREVAEALGYTSTNGAMAAMECHRRSNMKRNTDLISMELAGTLRPLDAAGANLSAFEFGVFLITEMAPERVRKTHEEIVQECLLTKPNEGIL